MLGIDLVIPDISYLKENIQKVKGFVITHGHEDHIGALPYVLKEINVPIYATKLTIGLIENKLREHEMLNRVKRKVIQHGQSINLGAFRIEFIKTNHSIVDASALAIYCPAGIVVHTGDFKVDYTPVFGDAKMCIRDSRSGFLCIFKKEKGDGGAPCKGACHGWRVHWNRCKCPDSYPAFGSFVT